MKVKISEYAKMKNVTARTVWNWIRQGKVTTEVSPTGRHSIAIGESPQEENVAVYCRVSSSENKSNLNSQKDRLVSYCNARGYKVSNIVTEIGSGLNDSRPKLEKLLLDSSITVIVVEHADRLTRFGLNYIETLLAMQDRRVEIINPVETEKEDLIEDFVSIITSFCARLYGQRRTKRRTEKLIKSLEVV